MTETDSSSDDVVLDKAVKPLKKLQRKYNNDRKLFKAAEYLRLEMKRKRGKYKKHIYPLSTEPCREHISNHNDRTDPQIQLHCRQLSSIVVELRKSILQQNWDNTRILLTILSYSGLKYYSSIIIRTCFLLLFSHHKSSKKLLDDFVKASTGYILNEDVDKFIRILLALRQKELPVMTTQELSKRRQNYKVTQDPDFEAL